MRKIALKLVAVLALVAGLATLWLPIPTGLVLIAVGVALLLMTSPQVAGWMRWLRHRYPGLDRQLLRIEPHLPGQLREALAKTRAGSAP